ncbi:glycerophosphodiester phosphodiesterase GDPD2-like isoform X2 [Tasmannia lanceolata]|uniref:glycerophosphodiester phosphodiesterase GDPD2-like isoform X2 n=1 Tax=Tasmannia lanceolata TaxID=3420 RepID=UPI00406459E9
MVKEGGEFITALFFLSLFFPDRFVMGDFSPRFFLLSLRRRRKADVVRTRRRVGKNGFVALALKSPYYLLTRVTRDDCPVIFHDNFILTEEDGSISEKRISELSLEDFFLYGPQREPGNVGKSMLKKAKDGRIYSWKVEDDDTLCTLQEAFQRVDPCLGFNIELKFDDNIVYEDDALVHVLQVILGVVFEYAQDRPIIFSSFQPDAARLVRKLQNVFPVYFLTNGGSEVYSDVRRNSLDEAIKLCLGNGLQGIVSEVKAIFRHPATITRIKEANLGLLTYGQLNNVPEAVYMQYLMGIDGVIVDLVKEITEAVSDFIKPAEEGEESLDGEKQIQGTKRPKFSQHELSFLLKLIPELIQV